MDFAGINYLAVIIAAVVAFIFGAFYYSIVAQAWMKAARIVPEGTGMNPMLLFNSILCELVMAFVMAGLMGHFDPAVYSIGNGATTGFFLWLGFMVTTMAVNHRYENFGWDLTIIDGLHWLGVALLMGMILGWFGA